MSLKEKARILDKEGIDKSLKRIAHEIVENDADLGNTALIGIKNRGAYVAERLADRIKEIAGTLPEVGALDITLYRDDLTQVSEQPIVHSTEITFNIDKKRVILVDDVLYTGRTIRCALDALVDFGRPSKIQLAVLIDRGHRELPIRADYVGKNVPTSVKELVEVRLAESDGKDEVVVCER
jgi:pyrimidine operon attenuation protein/uracil phosphoribosyltransferase